MIKDSEASMLLQTDRAVVAITAPPVALVVRPRWPLRGAARV
jgi:hypothetical protein